MLACVELKYFIFFVLLCLSFKSSSSNTIPPKMIFSSGTLIMCMGVRCIPVEIRRCPGYAKNILPKTLIMSLSRTQSRAKTSFQLWRWRWTGCYSSTCSSLSLNALSVQYSSNQIHSKLFLKTERLVMKNHRNTLGLDHQYETFSPDERQPSW